MSAPPTTRASRSRYSSPAVGGGVAGAAGARNEGSSRGRGAAGSSNATAFPAVRASSTERSRRFMENWIEPERVRMPSFQEHGLVRQGVLETMEPLGTVPKPALIKKLTGVGKEASPTPSARGGKKRKIILTRKNGPSTGTIAAGATATAATAAAAAAAAASSALGLPELMSDLQSPSPSTVATPQPGTSPISTPAPATLPEHSSASAAVQNSSPTPTPKLEQLATPTILPLSDPVFEQSPEPQLDADSQPPPSSPPNLWDSIHRDHLRPPPSTSNPFLPDPIKESIEGTASRNLPGTPQSVHSSASTYDSVTDEYYKRGTSIPSRSLFNMPYRRVAGVDGGRSASYMDADDDPTAAFARMQQRIPQPPLGPWYTDAELTRIIQQKDVVKTAIERGVAEALKHRCYVDAYALRFAYDEHQDNARFLLQTEAVYRQMATKEAAGEWARTLQPYKTRGQEYQTALKYFVPEAETDKDFDLETHKPLPAPYAHLVSIDLSEVRNGRRKRATTSAPEAQNHDEDQNLAQAHLGEAPLHKAQAQPDEAEEPERVATPPRRRQKTQTETRDSFKVGEASTPSARAMDNVDGCTDAAPPVLRETRAGSNVSDVSSLSSARSITPVEEPGQEAEQGVQPGGIQASTQDMQDGKQGKQPVQGHLGAGEGVADVSTGVDGTSTAVQPISEPLRRLPARKARNLAPNAYLVLPPDSDAASNFNSNPTHQSHSRSHSSNLANNSPTPDAMSLGKHQDDNGNGVGTTTTATTTNSSSSKPPKRSQRGLPDYAPAHRLDPADDKLLMRMAAQKRTHDRTEEARARNDSFVRAASSQAPTSPVVRPGSSSSSLSSVPEVEEMDIALEHSTLKARATNAAGARATRATKRSHDEIDDAHTPFSVDFGGEAGTSTGGPSRAVTPRPQKKQKKEVRRFKQSPTKNKAGPSAAAGVVPTRAANRSSPVMNGAPSNQEENDDFCSFCGGSGNLVCCDGCNKAFHYMDHEPVVDPNEDAAWFCWDCMVKRDPNLIGEYKGPFGALMTNLDKRHAKAFVLPKKVRDYFDGVRTGADGEYEEFLPPTKGKKKKETEEEKKKEFDFFQLADKDNNPILCHSCSLSAESSFGRRPIVSCSLCGLWWHADCLDPPKSQPPNPRSFVCPCHIDDLLLHVPAQLGPAHRFRKIKGSSEINYAFRRGNINNGWIEVEDDLSEDEAMCARTGFRDPDSWGKKYILPASGIRDDFIAAIGRPRHRQPEAALPAANYGEDAEGHYEAALNILAFSRNNVTPIVGRPAKFSSLPVGVVIADQSVAITDQGIEAANASELEIMQQHVQQLQERISAQLRIRGGESEPGRSTSMRRTDTWAAVCEASEHQIEASEESGGEVESAAVEDSGTVSNPHDVGLILENDDPTEGSAQAANKASHNGMSEIAALPVVGNVVPHKRSAVPTSPHVNEPNGCAPPSNGGKTVTGGNSGREPIVQGIVDKTIDQPVDAALTPPADITKDGEDLASRLRSVKPTSNGVETPETTVPDQALSPGEAEGMDLDEYDDID